MEHNREYMLRIFPGLEEYWDRDDGKTFLEVFFWIYCNKMEIYNRWRNVKFHKGPIGPLEGLDVIWMKMRLSVEEEDGRPYFSEEQEDFLDDLDDRLIMGPVTFSREETCEILEMSLAYKVSDEENRKNMKDLLRYMFEFKERCLEIT